MGVPKDYTGKKYGMLTPIRRLEKSKNGYYIWLCKCDCGNEEFYVRQSYSGTCEYNMRFDGGTDVENGSMWDGATMKDLTKYAYCNNCNKRLFLIDEYYKALWD